MCDRCTLETAVGTNPRIFVGKACGSVQQWRKYDTYDCSNAYLVKKKNVPNARDPVAHYEQYISMI